MKSIRNFGVLPSPPDKRDYAVAMIVPPVSLPLKISMRDKVCGVFDQGFCGTCVGKASNGVMSATFEKKLSSLYIYARCKLIDGMPDQEGTYPRVANKIMQDYGSCLDSTLPYNTLKQCTVMPKITPQMDKEASKFKIKRYARAYNLNDIKQGLANGHMVKAVILVGDSFIFYKDGIMGPAQGTLYGYHEVYFCGYSDEVNAFEGVNSWGDRWGDNGFFWLSYEAAIMPTLVESWVIEIEPLTEDTFYPDRIFRDLWRKEGKNINDELKKNS